MAGGRSSGREGGAARAERILAAHRALIALGEAVTAGLTPQQLLEQVAVAARAVAAEATVHLWLVTEDGAALRLAAEYEPDPERNAGPPRRLVRLGEGLVGTVAERREPVAVPAVARDPRLANPAWVRDRGFVSFAGVPFARGDRLLGVFTVFTRRRHRFPRHAVDLLRAFASHAATALETAELFAAAARRLRRLEALREIEREIVQQRDLEELLVLIGRRATELLEADSAAVWLWEDAPAVLRARAAFGVGAWIRDVAIRLGEDVVGVTALRRDGLVVNDYPRSSYAIAPFRAVNQAVVAQPLIHGGALQGVIVVNRHTPGRPFADGDLAQLGDFGVQASIALENARLLAEARRRQEVAERLAAVGQTLTGSLDLATVLARVADGVQRLLRSDGGAVGLVEGDDAVRMTAAVGLGAKYFGDLVLRRGQGVGGRVLESGEPFWTSDYLGDPRISADFREGVRRAGLVSELAVPVRLQERIVGLLWASYARPVAFGPDDVARASSLAQIAAVAVANARLYAEARQREAEARTLFEVGRLISATLEPERVLDVIAEKARELMGVRACGVFELGPPGQLRYARGVGLSADFVRGLVVAVGEGTSGRSVAEGAPVWTPDILEDPAVALNPSARALIEREGYRAVLSVPIEVKGAPFGCLAAYWWAPHTPTPAEIETLASLAALAAIALENARLYGEARGHAARLEELNRLGQAVYASLRLDEVLANIARAAGALFDAPIVSLWVADEERRVLLRRAGHGAPELLAPIPLRLAYGEAGAGWVALHRAPLLDLPVPADARVAAREVLAARAVTSFSGVPILAGERLLGVLALGSRKPLDPAELALLDTLLGQAAIAIENARLYGEARGREAEAVALAEATRRFGQSLRREAVLEALAATAAQVLGDRWVVFGVEPDGGPVRMVAQAPAVDEDPSGGAVPVGEALVRQVAATGTPRVIRDVRALPDGEPARADLEARGVRSVLLVPVAAGSVAHAVLAGSVHGGPRQFGDHDLQLAQAVADRAATALENARLYQELTRAYDEVTATQAQLVQTEKLRALGEMASGVAHDFNNILAAILGRVQLMHPRLEDPTLRRWVEIIERAALDGAQTVRRIQEFTRIRRDQPTEPVDVAQVVRDAIEMTRPRWRDEPQALGLDIKVEITLDPVPPVDGHAAELRQALTNLILNAVDALPQGGVLGVETRVADAAVEIRVRDTGVGMSEAVQRRIFEPFFTTKGPKGTGLGLAMVYGILARHRGTVTVDSREGAGTTFTLRLPVGRCAARPSAPLPGEPATGGLRVLVVDDDEDVRETLADMLRQMGHAAVTAADGAAGLERFRAEAFDLVVTDLGMPGLSGWHVAQAVKAARADVPVVLVTGWGVEVAPDRLRQSGVDRVLAKPVRLAEVQAVVVELERGRAGAGGDAGSGRRGS